MNILAFDCAGSSCSAALLRDGAVAAHRFVAMERGQAEALMPMIEAVLAEAQIDLAAIDLLGVTTGPGGFTGLRIGLATARGLALASGIPLVGVTCFAAVAAAVPETLRHRPLLVALESKREELFLQTFTPEPGIAALVAPRDWRSWALPDSLVLAGDGAPRFAAAIQDREFILAPGPGLPDARDVTRVAATLWRNGDRPPSPMPLYLRAPDTTGPATALGVEP